MGRMVRDRAQVPVRHLGNVAVTHVPRSYVRADVAPKLDSGARAFDASAYLTPHSDVVALLVLNHQLHISNLLIRLGWEARVAEHDASKPGVKLPDVRETARELVDYMLFVDEAPLPSPVKGSTSFAQEFSSRGPRDGRGRSLRDFDLTRRLLRYPCSYMIYSETFDALPPVAKNSSTSGCGRCCRVRKQAKPTQGSLSPTVALSWKFFARPKTDCLVTFSRSRGKPASPRT